MQPPAALIIENDEDKITRTNFWATDYNQGGLFFVSTNAACVRLLVPDTQQASLADMRTAREIVLTRGPYQGADAVEILFDDRTDTPFALWLDAQKQFDRVWPASDDGRKLGFAIYVKPGKRIWSADCHVRRATALPCLLPWKGH